VAHFLVVAVEDGWKLDKKLEMTRGAKYFRRLDTENKRVCVSFEASIQSDLIDLHRKKHYLEQKQQFNK